MMIYNFFFIYIIYWGCVSWPKILVDFSVVMFANFQIMIVVVALDAVW